MYFIVQIKRYFYCKQKDEIGKERMTTDTNYIIFTETLRIKIEMWTVTSLNILFVTHIFLYFFKAV